ncbi:TIM-barrel domain-containing protein [Streptomyces sp. B6B3]|uniref:glycoside hydrolase family 31 protein n=1 Tax=Streptomyces sp. B6B3 TaxID=3153570 RepID=UPI00325D6632
METDPYVACAPETGGRLRVTLGSGRVVRFACSVPVPGVLRLRTEGAEGRGADELLVEGLADHPARLTGTSRGTVISGPGVEALWGPAEGADAPAGPNGDVPQRLSLGPYERFAEAEGRTVPFHAGRLPAADGRPAGWVETIHLAPDAAVYGGGESYQGINLRGRHRRLRNIEENRAAGRDSAYLNVPLLWSDAGWAVFARTGEAVDADIGATHSEAARLLIGGDELDLFLITGDAPAILARYHALTGVPCALPDWAYGVWMSRSSYFTADEVLRTVDELRAAGCPVDVVHVDEWLAESVLDDASWTAGPDRRRFPAGWSRPLAERGVRTSLWINPYVSRDSPLAHELSERGHLVHTANGRPAATADNPETVPVDFTNAEARAWWRRRLARVLREEGNTALLADFGEEIAEDAVFADGSVGGERRDSYGVLYQKVVREAGAEVRGADFVPLCRSGSAGSQRYAAHWAGDMPSTWSGLTCTLRAVLSMSLSGFSAVTFDAGGYWTPDSFAQAGELRRGMTPDAVFADVDPELYGRWVQWAAFAPIMRMHGMGRREPTAYPEPARSAAIEACRLRHRLRRYLIRCAVAASQPPDFPPQPLEPGTEGGLESGAERESWAGDGLPLMRPMPLAYPGDRRARDADLQYLLGPDVLVAPILQPGGHRALYVPPGEWTPLVGCPPLTGPAWADVECAPDQFPAFARADTTHRVLDPE